MTTPASNGQGEGAEAVARAIIGGWRPGHVLDEDLRHAVDLLTQYAEAVAKKAVEEANKMLDNLNGAVADGCYYQAELEKAKARIQELENTPFSRLDARIKELESALTFYADHGSYCKLFAPALDPQDPRTFAPVLQDGGKLARATAALLRAKEQPQPPAESVPPERSV